MDDCDFKAGLGELFSVYRDVVKPLLAQVEAVYEAFPTPVYNEVRSFTDHLSRCVLPSGELAEGHYIKDQFEKAEHHLKRIIFDCFKLLIIDLRKQVEAFEKATKYLDLRSIDADGRFSATYAELRKNSVDAVKHAKTMEALGNDDVTANAYQTAFATYESLCNHIQKYEPTIARAKRRFWGKRALAIAGCVGSFVLGKFLDIVWDAILRLF